MSPISPPSLASCHRLDEYASTLMGPHLRQFYFDGSLSSGLELAVNDSFFGGSFTLVLFLKPDPHGEGQILEYTAGNAPTTDTTSVRISRLQVGFAAAGGGGGGGGGVEVAVWSVDQSAAVAAPVLCTQLLLPGVALTSHSWTSVTIRSSVDEAVRVSVNTSVWTGGVCTESSTPPTAPLGQGRLSLGGRRADGGAGYRGAMGCLMLFPVALDTTTTTTPPSPDASSLLDLCLLYGSTASSAAAEHGDLRVIGCLCRRLSLKMKT
ncbi:uncharacterized protein LOC143287780 [Babylonia areolata]|uniref:uncharacterized protein LOC143287780 n=1 Tax=Babylonia areolata TaxID=304850 RepID=UPI003FD08AE9